MHRYRYRTKALVGPWRATQDEAAGDAIRAGQAQREPAGGPLRWIVAGEIEMKVDRSRNPAGSADESGGDGPG